MSLVAGFVWLVAAALAYKSSPRDTSVPKSSCCCCPMPIDMDAYGAIPIEEDVKESAIKVEVKEGDAEEHALVADGKNDAGEAQEE